MTVLPYSTLDAVDAASVELLNYLDDVHRQAVCNTTATAVFGWFFRGRGRLEFQLPQRCPFEDWL